MMKQSLTGSRPINNELQTTYLAQHDEVMQQNSVCFTRLPEYLLYEVACTCCSEGQVYIAPRNKNRARDKGRPEVLTRGSSDSMKRSALGS